MNKTISLILATIITLLAIAQSMKAHNTNCQVIAYKTDLNLDQIAEQAGYTVTVNLYLVFSDESEMKTVFWYNYEANNFWRENYTVIGGDVSYMCDDRWQWLTDGLENTLNGQTSTFPHEQPEIEKLTEQFQAVRDFQQSAKTFTVYIPQAPKG